MNKKFRFTNEDLIVGEGKYDWLVTKLAIKFGYTETKVRNKLGAVSGGRTRGLIRDDIMAILAALPEGVI